jgi:putative chitinase
MPNTISYEDFAKFAPRAISVPLIVGALNDHMERCEITTDRRIRHFMAHHYVESAGFSLLEENLNYSAARLVQVWPRRFPNVAAATPYARNPRALANKVYGGRMGNLGTNEGFLYRGGGFNQLTGLNNYVAASTWTGIDLVKNPQLARTIPVAAQIACDFWRANGLNAIVDADAGEGAITSIADVMKWEEDDLVQGTRRINGGINGLDHRRDALKRAAGIW